MFKHKQLLGALGVFALLLGVLASALFAKAVKAETGEQHYCNYNGHCLALSGSSKCTASSQC